MHFPPLLSKWNTGFCSLPADIGLIDSLRLLITPVVSNSPSVMHNIYSMCHLSQCATHVNHWECGIHLVYKGLKKRQLFPSYFTHKVPLVSSSRSTVTPKPWVQMVKVLISWCAQAMVCWIYGAMELWCAGSSDDVL